MSNNIILVYYQIQQKKEQKQEYNVYTVSRKKDLTILEVIEQFPLLKYSHQWHFRFRMKIDQIENSIVWMDISNLRSMVPVENGKVYMKVQKMDGDVESKMFGQLQQMIQEAKVDKQDQVKTDIRILNNQQSRQMQQQNNFLQRNIDKWSDQQSSINLQNNNANLSNHDDLIDTVQYSQPNNNSINNNMIDTNSNIVDNSKQQQGDDLLNGSDHGDDLLAPEITKNKTDIQQDSISDSQKNIYILEGMTESDLYNMSNAELLAHKQKVLQMMQDQKVQELNANWQNEQKQKDMRLDAKQLCDPEIDKWAKTNQESNGIRKLLATIDQLIQDDQIWKPVTLTQLINESSVKTYYRKALLKIHPDKVVIDRSKYDHFQAVQIKYKCEKIIQELNQAFKKK